MGIRQILSTVVCMIAFAAVADDVISQASGTTLPRQRWYQLEFTLPEKADADAPYIRLEFDGRIDYPSLSGHNATAMTVFVNDKAIPAARMVNCPIEFRRANGNTGEAGRWRAPRWNYEACKTGILYEDLILKHGGDAYGLVYSPDFESIDSKKYIYRSPGFSRKHFVFDLTGMTVPGKNTVTIYNPINQEMVDAMNNKSDLPLVIKDVKIIKSAAAMTKPQPFWLAELEAESKKMAWVEPITDWGEKFNFSVNKDGIISINVNKNAYYVLTTFSYPDKTKKANGFPRPVSAESKWQIKRTSGENGSVVLEAAGSFYSVRRQIASEGNYLEITDRITNVTGNVQPVFIRNKVRVKSDSVVYLSGLKVEPDQNARMYFPENPTAFAETADGSGLGIVPYDDILRIHGMVYQNGKDMELRDEQLVLAPGKSVELKWQLFPVNKGGYMRFVNNVRHAWKIQAPEVNGLFWNHILKPVAANWKPKKGVEVVSIFNTCNGGYLWGSAVENNPEFDRQKKEIIASVRKAAPDIKIMASYMAIYFSNGSFERDMERFKDSVIVNKNGTYPTESKCRFYIPSRDNAFGKMVESNIDRIINTWGVNGIYFDYMEGADAYFTYNRHDGVSGDIRESDGQLKAVKGSYQLLSQDFLIYLLKKIHSKGLFIRANRNNFTTTVMNSVNDIVPVRFTECGYPDQLARGHLAPCPMGLQRTLSNKLELQTLRALYEGLTTSPYHTAYRHGEYDNPVSAMWPIAYREMRRGVIIGENKIVTAVSGYFGFGDKSALTVRFYDKDGRRQEKNFPVVAKDGKNYVEIKLQTGEIAVIDRVK
ncbi:MAG: hypothetical protein E7057_10390 [Lentisphaerae bacterium]|nr:hypothetical protein [Lentisphaerota bacterium]